MDKIAAILQQQAQKFAMFEVVGSSKSGFYPVAPQPAAATGTLDQQSGGARNRPTTSTGVLR